MNFWITAARTSALLKVRNEYVIKNRGNINNSGENGKQYVEMVWRRSMHGG
jgi:hypothetical protein